jgi:uncharacterized membrane protein YfcA
MNFLKRGSHRLKNRSGYIIVFLILFAVEVYIAVYVHDSFIRPYLGDVLVVILIYCALRGVNPNKPSYLSLYVFVFAVAVEVSQYFKLVKLLGLERNRFVSIILGTSFSWLDILCYTAGCLLLLVLDMTRNFSANNSKKISKPMRNNK